MPVMRYFIVKETRQVKISASDPAEAIHLANKVFKGEPIESNLGRVLYQAQVIELEVTEEL